MCPPAASALCHLIGVGAQETIAAGTRSLGGRILDNIADAAAEAAAALLDAVWGLIDSTTRVDLNAGWITSNTGIIAAIALPMVVGLFIWQVIIGVIRAEPGAFARAVGGAAAALLGAAAAATVTMGLLRVVDLLAAGIMDRAGTSMQQAGERLLPVSLLVGSQTGKGLPALLVILFSIGFIIGAVIVWGTLLVRAALIIVASVFAPLAFAGLAARFSSGWLRRWATVMLALILSKLVVAMVFTLALSAIEAMALGQAGSTAAALGAMTVGLILLLIAAAAPWLTYRFIDFLGGEIGQSWHRSTSTTALSAVSRGQRTAASMIRHVPSIPGRTGPPAATAAAHRNGHSSPTASGPSAGQLVRSTRSPGSQASGAGSTTGRPEPNPGSRSHAGKPSPAAASSSGDGGRERKR